MLFTWVFTLTASTARVMTCFWESTFMMQVGPSGASVCDTEVPRIEEASWTLTSRQGLGALMAGGWGSSGPPRALWGPGFEITSTARRCGLDPDFPRDVPVLVAPPEAELPEAELSEAALLFEL